MATAEYADASLRRLRAPTRDAADLADILADKEVGGFSVTSVIDRTAHEIRLAVESFLADRDANDLLLVYLSCHGLVDARRRLYFAAADTTKQRLAATGIESRWLMEQLEDCRARRQIIILDCCFSGAFALNAKGENHLDLGDRLGGQSRGRVVLTASRATEYSFEGEPVDEEPSGSVFTSCLLDGVRTGAADINNDGYVSVEEAYEFAFQHVRAAGASQTPQRWVYGAEGGSIVLARSPAGRTIGAAPLPPALADALDSPYPEVRIGAVRTLGQLLRSPDPSKVLGARQTLYQIADGDTTRVAGVARELLDAQHRPASPVGTATPRPRSAPTTPAFPGTGPVPAAGASDQAQPVSGNDREDEFSPPEPRADILATEILDEELQGLRFSSMEVSRRALPVEESPSGLVARYLFPTEKFRGEWRRHWFVLCKQTAYAAVFIAAAVTIAATNPRLTWLPSTVDQAAVRAAAQVVLYGSAAILLWSNLTWYFGRFTLSNKRVMLVTGFFRRRVAQVPLMRVTDMKYTQTPLGRLLDYGTFLVESARPFGRTWRIRNLPYPNELYLRIVEEMYEPEAVEARLGRVYSDDA